MSIKEKPDEHGVAEGAQRLALATVIRALVDHATSTDPGFRDRIGVDIEDYITRLGPQSNLERDFAERARAYAAVLSAPVGQ
jgi:hypothetical protein